MFVVIEMGGGYSGDPEYVDMVYGPFASEKDANAWLRTHKRRWGWFIKEVFPAT